MQNNSQRNGVIGAIIGALAGLFVSKKLKTDNNQYHHTEVLTSLSGGILGWLVGRKIK